MDAETFENIVVEVLDSLPPEFAQYLDNIEVLVESWPTQEHRQLVDLKPWQTLYGLYHGVPLTERGGYVPPLPDTVIIFRGPLTRDFREPTKLRAQIRRTVLHEIAHFFGISDARLIELDAY
ncbi:MAG: metallopeptidase family protein [Chloroflexota bacterium]